MPWRKTQMESERLKFVAALVEGKAGFSMTELCRAYGISRKTGYKWWQRFEDLGVDGLNEQSRAPKSAANKMPAEIEQRILKLKAERPYLGARKLRVILSERDSAIHWPALSTIGDLLKRRGLVKPRRRRRQGVRSERGEQRVANAPNEIWAADYKGWFRTADGERCNPLTITDECTRLLVDCRAVESANTQCSQPVFERAFREYGMPSAMRTDNGPPFASNGIGGLTRLSLWWVKSGIELVRIEPGHPEQNGRHERMHRTLAEQTATPPRSSVRAQQRAFDRFRREYNEERPHEGIGDVPPMRLYEPSPRVYRAKVGELEYPADYERRRVRHTGEIKWRGKLHFLGEALAREVVGFARINDRHWRIFVGPLEIALLDDFSATLVPYLPRGTTRAADLKDDE